MQTSHKQEVEEQYKFLKGVCETPSAQRLLPKECKIMKHLSMEDLEEAQSYMELIEQAITEVMDKARQKYPPFYCVSPEHLIPLIFSTKNVDELNKHIKCVPGAWKNIKLVDNGTGAISAIAYTDSPFVMKFQNPLFLKQFGEEIADLFKALENEIESSLKDVMKRAVHNLNTMESHFPPNFDNLPNQVVLTAWLVDLTSILQQAMKKDKIDTAIEILDGQIKPLIERLRLPMSNKAEEALFSGLMMNFIGYKQVCQRLVNATQAERVKIWKQHPKFVFENGLVFIKSGDQKIQYKYRLVENKPMLSMTKEYLSVFSNIIQNSGVLATVGFPGVGKTATVLEVMWYCGINVDNIMFNQNSPKESCLGILKSITPTHTVIMDNYNIVETQVIRDTLKELIDKAMEPDVRIFQAFNPGHPLRKELPSEFRSICTNINQGEEESVQLGRPWMTLDVKSNQMMQAIIACKGFQNYESLAEKLIQFNERMKEDLPKKEYYDYGLRTLYAYIRIAKGHLDKGHNEFDAFAYAIKQQLVARLPEDQKDSVLSVISQLFLGNLFTRLRNLKNFTDCNYKNIIESPYRSLFELMKYRHGTCAVVPEGQMFKAASDLSSFIEKLGLWQTKVYSFEVLPENVDTEAGEIVENSVNAIFGHFNKSKVWQKGALEEAFKDAQKDPETIHYVVMYGEGNHNIWDKLNTVTDDNKHLQTENNGELVKMGDNVKLIMVQTERICEKMRPSHASRLGFVNML